MKKLKLILTASAIVIAVAAALALRETKQTGNDKQSGTGIAPGSAKKSH